MYTTCISLVYHVYITTSKQRKLSSIYEYSDNSFVISIHKEKPRKFNISRTSQYNLYLRNSRSVHVLGNHSLSTGTQYSWGFQTFLYIICILLVTYLLFSCISRLFYCIFMHLAKYKSPTLLCFPAMCRVLNF